MLDPVRNFAKGIVSTGYNAAATSVALLSGYGALFPNPDDDGAFNVVWWNITDYADPADDPDKEIVRVTDRITDTFEVTRAQEGTSASAKNIAGKTYAMILAATRKTIEDIEDRLNVDDEVPTGDVDDSNVTFAFSAKPKRVVINGQAWRESSQIGGSPAWVWSAPNVITQFPVGQGGDIYGIMK